MIQSLCLIIFIAVFVSFCHSLEGPNHGKVVVCYVATWASYRIPPGTFQLEDLDPGLCTHLVYSFAGLDENNFNIKSLDPTKDLQQNNGKAGFKRMVALKQKYPHLKVTIAIGGWNEGSLKYSTMAADSVARAKFIKSVLQFLDKHKFDGLDLDWEYPGSRDGRAEDKGNYVLLVKELKEAFEPLGYILTAAFGVHKEIMDAAYDFAQLNQYLDLIHVMCYDYHTFWDGAVGANAPLRGYREDDKSNIEYTLNYLISHGVSPHKMVMGLPTYGKNFILEDPGVKDIVFGVTPVERRGFEGPFTQQAGFIAYSEICMELNNESSSWTYHWHGPSSTPYLRDGDRIISYDDGRSIAAKIKMAVDYDLAGLMVWTIDTDDFKGLCSGEKNTYVDFGNRYKKIVEDPVKEEALKMLGLPDENSSKQQRQRTAYATSNGKLYFQPPEEEYSNYAMMRVINDVTAIAVEEKRILQQMQLLVEEENEAQSNGVVVIRNRLILLLVICFIIILLGVLRPLGSSRKQYTHHSSRLELLKDW